MIKVPVECEIPKGYTPKRYGLPRKDEWYLVGNSVRRACQDHLPNELTGVMYSGSLSGAGNPGGNETSAGQRGSMGPGSTRVVSNMDSTF